MPMMMSQILKSVVFIKKHNNLDIQEQNILEMKKFINYTSRIILLQKLVLQQRYISGVIDHCFIMERFLKIREKIKKLKKYTI